jgi:hypothetical protein
MADHRHGGSDRRWLALVPLVFLIWQSFMTPLAPGMPALFTLANYSNVYTQPETFRLFGNCWPRWRRRRALARHRHHARLAE